MSVVRNNILKYEGYTPYCGAEMCGQMPRTFFNGDQFQCGCCGWVSAFEQPFIKEYKTKWQIK